MEDIFKIKYNTKLDKTKIIKEKVVNIIKTKINKHKFLFIIISMFFILSAINFYLIISFMKVLQNI